MPRKDLKKGMFCCLLVLATTTSLYSQQWEFIPELYGGGIREMAETSHGTLYVVTDHGGMFRSDSRGNTWQRVRFDTDNYNWDAYHISINSNDKIFVVTETGRIYSSVNGSDFIYLTTIQFTKCIIKNPIDGTLVLITGQYGLIAPRVLHSTDEGVNWTEVLNNGPDLADVFFLPSGELVATASSYQVVMSTDGGRTFSPRYHGLGNTDIPVSSLVVSKQGIFYLLTKQNVYSSADYGISWNKITGNLPGGWTDGRLALDGDRLYLFNATPSEASEGSHTTFATLTPTINWTPVSNAIPFEGDFSFNVHVSANHELFFLSDGKGIFKSTDNGATWVPSNTNITAFDFYALDAAPNGNVLLAPDNGTVTYSPPRESWLVNSDRYPIGNNMAASLFRLPNGTEVGIGTKKNISVSLDDGITWTSKTYLHHWFLKGGHIGNSIYALTVNDEEIYSPRAEIVRSDDNGNTWTVEYTMLYQLMASPWVFAIDSQRNAYVAIPLSENGDMMLTHIDLNSKTQTARIKINYWELYISNDRIFLSMEDEITHSWGIRYSDDHGASFSNITAPNFLGIPKIRVYNDEIFILGDHGKIFRSNDFGQHWDDWSIPVGGSYVDVRDFVHAPDGKYFAVVQNKGLYLRVPYQMAVQNISFSDTKIKITDGPVDMPIYSTSGLDLNVTSSDESVLKVQEKKLVPIRLGEATLRASQSGNSYFNPAAGVEHRFSVVKGDQSITFEVADHVVNEPPFKVNAKSTAGLNLTFSSSSGNIVITGDEIEIQTEGPVTLIAKQDGSELYNAAPDTYIGFCINPIPSRITANGGNTIITSTDGRTNRWYMNGQLLPGETNNSLAVKNNGTYFARTIVNGCLSDPSNEIVVNSAEVVTGFETVGGVISLYPNPLKGPGYLYINLEYEDIPAVATVRDIFGRQIIQQSGPFGKQIALDVSSLSPGIYLVSISQQSTKCVLKWMKE